MNVSIKLFSLLTLFCLCIHSTVAQDTDKDGLSITEFQQYTPLEIAKIQTQNLQESLKLDDAQVLKVYEVMLQIEKEMQAITNKFLDTETKMAEIEKWETIKTEKLKELLTTEQFSIYINRIISNKR